MPAWHACEDVHGEECVAKIRMRDIVIVLPGITGSVLQKDGKDLWAISGQAAWQALTSVGSSLRQLVVGEDNSDADDIGDGIRAIRLMPDAHLVPGLVKIDGYLLLSRLITDRFAVKRGSIDGESPANFFEFPYDWRRSRTDSVNGTLLTGGSGSFLSMSHLQTRTCSVN
jgi:hypothetical protein